MNDPEAVERDNNSNTPTTRERRVSWVSSVFVVDSGSVQSGWAAMFIVCIMVSREVDVSHVCGAYISEVGVSSMWRV